MQIKRSLFKVLLDLEIEYRDRKSSPLNFALTPVSFTAKRLYKTAMTFVWRFFYSRFVFSFTALNTFTP